MSENRLPELIENHTNASGTRFNRFGVFGVLDAKRLLVFDALTSSTTLWSVDTRAFIAVPGLPTGVMCGLALDPTRELLICNESHRWQHYVLNGVYIGKIANRQAPDASPYYVTQDFRVRQQSSGEAWVSHPLSVALTDTALARYIKGYKPSVSSPK